MRKLKLMSPVENWMLWLKKQLLIIKLENQKIVNRFASPSF